MPRRRALRDVSEISGTPFRERTNIDGTWIERKSTQIVDHIVPERIAVETGKDPHAAINLICILPTEHGQKRAAEDDLCKAGDMVTYIRVLNQLGWPMTRVYAALDFYGMKYSPAGPAFGPNRATAVEEFDALNP